MSAQDGRFLDSMAQFDNANVIAHSGTVWRLAELVSPDIWVNPQVRILDPVCKGGEFLQECALRLFAGLAQAIPDEGARWRTILHECLHGIAVNDLFAQISRRTLYCAADASSDLCPYPFDSADGNIRVPGAEAQSDSSPFKTDGALDMKFDLVIGNPPYQQSDGGHGASAKPLYHRFWRAAVAMQPKEIVMVVPARWYSGGKGLDEFRAEMLADRRMAALHDFPDSKDCFPDNDIAGGVCFLKWKSDHDGDCHVVRWHNGREQDEGRRPLDSGHGILMRKRLGVDLVQRVTEKGEAALSERVSTRKPFGMDTCMRGGTSGSLKLRHREGTAKCSKADVTKGKHLIDRWKVAISAASGAGRNLDPNGRRSILSTLELLPPKTVCTETYLTIGPCAGRKAAKRLAAYLDLKLPRYLIGLCGDTQHFKATHFRFVPDIGEDTDWTDEMLYDHYGLTQAERDEIERTIKPRAQAAKAAAKAA